MSAPLPGLDTPRPDLVRMYEDLTGTPVPRGLSQPILARIVAYDTQAASHGGLPLRIRNQLKSIASDQAIAPTQPTLRSGSRLVRDWNGVTHIVDVVKGGFRYRSKMYRSLSAVAREITGARWSGPRFFGLKAAS